MPRAPADRSQDAAGPGSDTESEETGHEETGHEETEHEEWVRRVRGETEAQLHDRNFVELLQELRVAQTGVQVLFAFLLGLGFTTRFDALEPSQKAVYVAALVLSALAAGTLQAPVMYHRMVFRRRLKERVVVATHRLALVGLSLVLVSMVVAVQLAMSLVVHGWATVGAAALGVVIAGLWFAWPAWELRRHDADAPDQHRADT